LGAETDTERGRIHRPQAPADADVVSAGRPRRTTLAPWSRRVLRLTRVLALPTMAAVLVLYIVVHSPLNHALASAFGFSSSQCYPCGGTPGAARFVDSFVALLFLVLALLAGAFVASLLADAAAERALAFGLATLAFVVVPSSFLAALGSALHSGLLRPAGGPLLSALPAAVAVGIGLHRGWRPRRPHVEHVRGGPLLLLVGVLGGGMVVASIFISLMHPATQGDALSYHAPLAVYLWSDGNLTAFLNRSPDIWALAHPGTAELWFGLLRVAGGERLADLGQLPFALLGSAAIGVFARRLGLRSGAALLASLAFLLSPLVVMQLGMQANDLLGGALLMATMALASAPVATWDRRKLTLIGLGLGLTATTKIALIPSVGALALFVAGALVWDFRGGIGRPLHRLLVVALAFAVVAAPWWSRNIVRFHNPIYPGNLPLVGNGHSLAAGARIDNEFVPRPIAWPLYPLLEPYDDRSGIGALFVVGIIPGFVLATFRARRQPLLLYATVLLLTLPAWWTYTLHEPRFLLAFLGLGLAFLPWSLMLLRGRGRVAGFALLGTAAVFSTLVTLDQALVPFARQPTERSAFYDQVWGVDPVVTALPRRDGLLLNTGYGPSFDYAAFYPFLGGSFDVRRVIVVDASGADASQSGIVATMRRHHLRFAYLSVVPSQRGTVRKIYDQRNFRLVRESGVEQGERTAVRRYLYRDVSAKDPDVTQRYLFELK
jgi:hypothetical protein